MNNRTNPAATTEVGRQFWSGLSKSYAALVARGGAEVARQLGRGRSLRAGAAMASVVHPLEARQMLAAPSVALAATAFTVDGDSSGDLFGQSASGAGDVNGDGFDDFIVGARNDDTNGSNSGSARVFSGIDGSTLFTFDGDSANDYLGFSVSGAGDVNGDGFDDVIVGVRQDDPNGYNSGSARVFSGLDGSVLFTFDGDNASDYFGSSVSDAGDVNGDGFDDLIVGAILDDNNGNNSGSARVFSGVDGSTLFTFNGDSTSDQFGSSVSSAGDVNGDGFDDLIVGAYLDDNNGVSSGSARVFSGVDGSTLFTFDGDSAEDRFGRSVSDAGDVNGDGFDDVIVGANGDDENGSSAGSARVFSGVDGSVLYTFYGDSQFDQFGSSVAGAGDVNGDGFHDLVVGANGDDDSEKEAGSVRVFSGVDGNILFTFDGDSAYDSFGASVSGVGDVNGDGLADIVVGATGDDNNGSNSGSARVFTQIGMPPPVPFTRGIGPQFVFDTIGISDTDDVFITRAVVQITGNYIAGEDFLSTLAGPSPGIVVDPFDVATGSLVFSGTATRAAYHEALRAVQFNNDRVSSDATRTITLTVTDRNQPLTPTGQLTGSTTRDIDIETPDNFPPTVVDSTFTINENDADGTIVGTINASDPDVGQTLTYAIDAGNDDGVFAVDPMTGVITINDDSTLNATTTPVYTLTVSATDDFAPSLGHTGTVTINVSESNVAPLLSFAGSGAFSALVLGGGTTLGPNDSAVAVFSDLVVDDVDDTNLSFAIVTIGEGYSPGQDSLAFSEALPANLLSTGFSAESGTLTLFGAATLAEYQAALRTVELSTVEPTFGGTRQVEVEVIDANSVRDPNGAGVGEAANPVTVDRLDFGDAPSTFGTLLTDGGARHQNSALFLGAGLDIELDGQPNAMADGDDTVGINDDNGMTFVSALAKGQGTDLTVTASAAGVLAGWIDYDQSGTFDPGERFERSVTAGSNNITIATPGSATTGDTFARFRLSSNAADVLLPTGIAPDGEVEDYAVTILETQREFGDAPVSYNEGTPKGAFHNRGTNIHWLGAARDLEPANQPSVDADADDLNGINDDDGVVFASPLAKGQTTRMTVTASVAGELAYWVDFDRNGTFDNATERFTTTLTAGANNLVFVTPGSTTPGDTFMRFRFGSLAAEIQEPIGRAKDGEVEDYKVSILSTQREYGDAPDTYRTSEARNGPRHNLGPNTHWLGAAVDREADASVSSQADGDDLAGINDDDGVVFTSLVAVGQTASIDVTASAAGELSYWVDFDRSGTFDPSENFTASLTAGVNALTFDVPGSTLIGPTYARFRFSTNAGQIANPFGVASNGEVEDYRVDIAATQFDFGDAPASYGTLLTDDGARHAIGDGTVFLGNERDTEDDGLPSGFADGDNNDGIPDDEDGITFTSSIAAGQQATFTAVVSTAGVLTWWIDADLDGAFDNVSERFSAAVVTGANAMSFTTPASTGGDSYMRFRLATAALNDPTGLAADGEVEDYRVAIDAVPALQASDSLFSDDDELAELLGSLS